MAKIQITEDLYFDLIRYHIYEDKSPEIEARIVAAIEQKVEAMAKRQTYTETLSGNQKRARDERV